MAATTTTNETFDKSVTSEEDMKELVKLRLQAGAIRSTYQGKGNTWILVTEWNLIGQQ